MSLKERAVPPKPQQTRLANLQEQDVKIPIYEPLRRAGEPRKLATLPPGAVVRLPRSPLGVLFSATVIVKFREGSRIRVQKRKLVPISAKRTPAERLLLSRARLDAGRVETEAAEAERLIRGAARSRVRRLFDRPAARLAAEKAEAERASGEEMADPGLYYAIPMDGASLAEIETLVDGLNALDVVEVAYPAPIPHLARTDVAPDTMLFTGQGYLEAAPGGIDARHAWRFPGGRGEGVRVMDVEAGWRLDHEDLPESLFFNGSGINVTGHDHGTAVLGVIGAVPNLYGFSGISPRASLGVNTWVSIWGLPGAIDAAAAQLRRGDTLLIEVHYPGPTSNLLQAAQDVQTGFVPVEYRQAEFDAIRRATARGIVVVEAAGNGSMDLDTGLFGGIFDRSVRDSGAIMVGAATPNARVPEGFTNFGSRVDVHAWGSNVDTLGYGDLTVPGAEGDTRQWYTRMFAGTSSASAIVAGATACLQGARTARGLGQLDSFEMRAVLRRTGTPQAADARQVGPLPDLRRAFDDQGIVAGAAAPTTGLTSRGGTLISPPAVGRNADGRLEAFVIGTDSRIWHTWQTAPNNGWSGWARIAHGLPAGVRLIGTPAVAPNADGRLEVFARGDDNQIWHVWQVAPNSGWSAWASLGGDVRSSPAVERNVDGRLEVFVRWADGSLCSNWQMWPNGAWHLFGWRSMGGNLQGAPAVASNADGRLEVFVRGTGNALQHVWQVTPGGWWSPWSHAGGVLTSDPVVSASGTGAARRLEVFARGTDAQLWGRRQSGPNAAFSGWTSVPGSAGVAADTRIAAFPDEAGTLFLFARWSDESLRTARRSAGSNQWSAWQTLGGAIGTEPAVGMNLDTRLEVFARGSDLSLVHRWEPTF